MQAMACNIIVKRINDRYSIARGVSPEVVDLTNEIQVQSKAKRKAEAVAAAAVLQAGDSNKKWLNFMLMITNSSIQSRTKWASVHSEVT